MRVRLLGTSFAILLGVIGATRAAPTLNAYVGKYPFDRVAGVAFLKHPLVVHAVKNAVLEEKITSEILGAGVSGPIERHGALIVSQACRPHDCGSVNWTIAMVPGRAKAAVCYHFEDLMGDRSRWFVGGSPKATVEGGCETSVPTQIAGLLAL